MTRAEARAKREARRAAKAARRDEAVGMRLAGATQREIAETLDLAPGTVSRMLRGAHDAAFQRLEDQVEPEMRAQIDDLRRIFSAAMEAWELSGQTSETEVVTRLGDAGSEGEPAIAEERISTRRRSHCGDPRYLGRALAAKAALRRLLGLRPAQPAGGASGPGPLLASAGGPEGDGARLLPVLPRPLPHQGADVEKLEQVLRMRQEGWTYQQIGRVLGCSATAVCARARGLQDRVLYRFAAEREAETRAQLAELRSIFRQAVSSWVESCREAETTAVTTGRRAAAAGGKTVDLPDLVVTRTQTRCGDARYLKQALAAKAGLRELLGLNASPELPVEAPGEPPVLLRCVDAAA